MTQAAQLAAGRPVRDPLSAIVAFADFDRFRTLPRAGGTFDQPAELMEEMRYVADVVAAARETRAKRAETSARRG